MVVPDRNAGKTAGHNSGIECRSRHPLEALYLASNRQFREGVRDRGLSLMSNNSGQREHSLAITYRH